VIGAFKLNPLKKCRLVFTDFQVDVSHCWGGTSKNKSSPFSHEGEKRKASILGGFF